MMELFSGWAAPILLSSLCLGFYDISKKHAVRDNAVTPVLFLATLSGSAFYLAVTLFSGSFAAYALCDRQTWLLIGAKSLLVAASWWCVYYSMRDLPISIAGPVRASAPLWTFIGAAILYRERPTPIEGAGMLAIFLGYYLFSVLGKREGFTLRHRGVHMLILGTLLGAVSALYDKYLLGVLHIPRTTLQFWFSVDLVLILGAALAAARLRRSAGAHPFEWRWTIPATGILLILADWLYFYALSKPDVQISILSLMRRSNSVVTFVFGCWFFHDRNVRGKALALALILLGVIVLAIF